METNFTMFQGDSQYLRIVCVDEDSEPIELENASNMEFKVTPYNNNGNNIVISKDASDIGIEDINIATIKLDGTDTSGLEGKFNFYFKVTDYGNDAFTKSGIFIIRFNPS